MKILGKREDGYHNIETTLSTINLSDIISLEEIESDIIVESEGLDIPQENNLCYHAADLFRKKNNIDRGVRVTLNKNIPVGGGLGGGSSDAACVVKGLNKLFGLGLSVAELTELCRDLGADVPFFIRGGAAYAKGRGDELKFFKLPKMSLVIYYPGYPVSTEWAYKEYDKVVLTSAPEPDMIVQENKKKKKTRVSFELANDFEKVIFKKHPDLQDVKSNLIASGAYVTSLSGSGSCLFTLIDSSNREKIIKYFQGIGARFFEVNTI